MCVFELGNEVAIGTTASQLSAFEGVGKLQNQTLSQAVWAELDTSHVRTTLVSRLQHDISCM